MVVKLCFVIFKVPETKLKLNIDVALGFMIPEKNELIFGANFFVLVILRFVS